MPAVVKISNVICQLVPNIRIVESLLRGPVNITLNIIPGCIDFQSGFLVLTRT